VFALISIDGADIPRETDKAFTPFDAPGGCDRISVSDVGDALSSRQHEKHAPIVMIYISKLPRPFCSRLFRTVGRWGLQ
jgi:hypothetical protein